MKKQSILRIVALVICIAVTAGAVYFGGILANREPERKTRKEYKKQQVTVTADKTKVLASDAHIAAISRGETPEYINKTAKELKKYGITLDTYTWADVENDMGIFSTERYKVIIYSDAYAIYEDFIGPLSKYIKDTGGFICIGGPAFEDIYRKSGSEYVFSRNMAGTYDADENTEYMGEIQLDCLSPAYQTYPVTNAASVVSGKDQVMIDTMEFGIPDDLFSPSPRAYGTGYNNLRTKRFVPLIEALDKKGEVAGYAAHMIIENSVQPDNTGAKIYASFNSNDEGFLETPQVTYAVSVVAAYMQAGVFFYEAGSDEYAYRPGDGWTIGAKLISREGLFNIGSGYKSGYAIEAKAEQDGKTAFEKRFELYDINDEFECPYGRLCDYSCGWTPENGGDYTVTMDLVCDGVLLDRLSHITDVYEEKPADERVYLTSKGYDLYLGDEVWKCFGVNYMPSSCIARYGDDYEKWLSSSAFEPEVVRKDLKRIKALGMNAVSSFVYYDANINNNNLWRFIDLCEDAGLKLYLSVREIMEPFYYCEANRNRFQELITRFGLAECDTVIGYDIAWETMPSYEPSWCNDIGMMIFDSEWTEWVKDNYGSIDAAESEWGFATERNGDGTLKGLRWLNAVSTRDENRRNAVNAYRRWTEDKTAEMFGRVVDDLHDVDPNHLVSARLGMYTGWPFAGANHNGWEYSAVAAALDIMGPEGYGYYRQWDTDFEGAAFSVAYSRASCEKPLIWFEFGSPCWKGSSYTDSYNDGKNEQLEYFKLINRMLDESRSNGIFYWWYAGGYRMNEGSDYGIINPDGSSRPVTKLLKKYADKFLGTGAVKKADTVVKMKPDGIGTGVCGVWNATCFDFQTAVKEGKIFGLEDSAAGTTSLDTSLECIGKQNSGPVRNLNADIRRVWYRTDSATEWKLLDEGGKMEVRKGETVEMKLTAVNTGIAKWICPHNAGSKAGGVYAGVMGRDYEISSDADRHDMIEIDGITFEPDRTKQVTLRMVAKDRTEFGEFFKFTVKVTD